MAKSPTTTLTVTVDEDGNVSTNFFNFTGTACLEAGQQLHALLAEFGVETEITTFTPKPELGAASASLPLAQAEYLQEGHH